MIRHVRGTITDIQDVTLIIDVHDIGYLVHTPTTVSYELDTEILLYTHHAIRDTASDLYGFDTKNELDMFELLLKLPKIGPKSALKIMSDASVELIQQSTITNDPEHLTKISGIGKKTAEKIVAGLKDKFENIGLVTNSTTINDTYVTDTIDALITLGYPQHTAREIVQQLKSDYPDIQDSAGALKAALKILAN